MKRIEWTLATCVVGLTALGCSGGGQSGPASAGEAVGPTTKAQNVTRCGPDGLIDDHLLTGGAREWELRRLSAKGADSEQVVSLQTRYVFRGTGNSA